MAWKGLQAGREGRRGGVVEEGCGGCWGQRDPSEGLSMSCLEALHAIDITAYIVGENFFIGHPVIDFL